MFSIGRKSYNWFRRRHRSWTPGPLPEFSAVHVISAFLPCQPSAHPETIPVIVLFVFWCCFALSLHPFPSTPSAPVNVKPYVLFGSISRYAVTVVEVRALEGVAVVVVAG